MPSCAKQGVSRDPLKISKAKTGGESNVYFEYMRADLQLSDDKIDESLVVVNKLIQENPNVASFYYQRALINTRLSLWPEVIEDCKEALRLQPTFTEAKVLLAKSLGTMKKDDEAIRYLEEVRKKDPSNEEISVLLAKGYLNAEQPKKAEQVMLSLLKIDSEAVSAYYYLGAIYGSYLHDFPKAIEIYKKLIEREPENVQIIDALSQLYLDSGKFKEALRLLEHASSIRPDEVTIKLKIALIHYKLKEYDLAIGTFNEILKLHPDSDKIRYYLGVLYDEIGRKDDAMKMYRSIPKKSGLYKDARIRLAYGYKESNNAKEAIKILKETINIMPKDIEFYQYLAGIYEREGRYKDAISLLQRALKYFPQDDRIYFAIAILHEKSGDMKAALKWMRKVVEINPNSAAAYNYIGYTILDTGGDIGEAEDMLQKAVILKPDDGYIMDSLGWLYFIKGDMARAEELLKRAYQLEPAEPTVLKHLGAFYLSKGDKKNALFYLERAKILLEKNERKDMGEINEVDSLIQKAR